jgi:hypothetical protein
MANETEVTLEGQLEKDFKVFVPSDKEKQVVSDTFHLFRQTADSRNRNFEFFDGLNLIEYIEDSVHRFNTNIFDRENMEEWQAGVNDQMTRNKVLAVLGKVMQVLPIAEFVGRGDEDSRKGIILTDLYQYVEDLGNYEEFMTHYLLEAIVKGSAIGYEGVEFKERKIRNVKGIDDAIKTTEDKEIQTNLFSAIVPLEDFYPSSVSIRKIEDMPYCFWRDVIPYSEFLNSWSNLDKSKIVQPQRTFADDEIRPFYSQHISDDIGSGNVELIRFYDRMNDEYIVIANGIWLNPIMQGDEEEVISPLPFNHKELPFFDVKFDFFGDWFYGKSLPDRLKSLQDVLNVLTNMLLDQSFLTIFPPMLTNGFDDIEDDYLRPGRRTPVDTQGLPINQAFMKLDLGTPSGWHQYILEYTRKIMEEASLDKVSQGIAGVGDRTTAQEIRVAADGVSSILQLFARMVNYSIKRKALLKGTNVLQFGTDERSPIIRKVLGDGSEQEINDVFNVFELNDAILTGGKRGTKVIEIYRDKAQLPTKGELKARAQISEADSGKKIEIVAFPPSYLRDFRFDVRIVPNVKNEATKELEKALQLEKVRVYMSFFPDLVDVNELAAQTAEKMGDDPAKVLKQDLFQPPVDPGREVDNGISTEPTENNANNLARSARGGDSGQSDLAALQANLTG